MSETRTDPVAMISSTTIDLPSHRTQVFDACLRQGIFPRMMEHLPASDVDSIAESLALVDSADIYIAILGYRYGYVPAGQHKSITEMEYDRAAERSIPRLIFIMDANHPVMPQDVEVGEGASKLEAFKARLLQNNIVNFFKSPEDLRAHVINSLSQFRYELQAKVRKSTRLKSTKQRELLRVFVASPRDVQDERSRMPKVVESLNRTLGRMLNVVIELWRWETDAPPVAGEPQALIDPELDEADVVVVIFWNRFGLPTQAGTTGTESEVLKSLERWHQVGRPQVMMYFCQRPSSLIREELEQRLKVLAFRERVSPIALTVDYEEVSDFEWRVRDDLFSIITKIYAPKIE